MNPSPTKREQHSDSSLSKPDALAVYREQIEHWARALSTGEIDHLREAVEEGVTSDQVIQFVDGNVGKRYDLLLRLLEFVEPVFENFGELVEQFVIEHPYQALDSTTRDADRCLEWIAETESLNPEQTDYIACQQARHAVEEMGAARRLEHVRFCEIRTVTSNSLGALESNGSLMLHINPIHVWTQFHTAALLDGDISLPADVVFFATGSEIRTAVVNQTAKLLLEELSEFGDLSLDEWALRTSHSDRAGLVAACKELAELELIAVC